MNLSVVQNGARASLALDPFPHAIIDPALPWDAYERLAAEYPEALVIEQERDEQGHTCRYRGARALREGRIPRLWESFVRQNTSTAFFRDLVALLEPALQRFYPERLPFLRSSTTALRQAGTADMDLECQFVVNLPSQETVRSAHLDNPRELYAVLFYMRSAEDDATGGDLELYEKVEAGVRYGPRREADPTQLRRVAQVPYAANRAVVFLNTPASFHGVSPRRGGTVNRRYMNIIAELPRKKGLLGRKKTTPWFEIQAS